MNTMLRNQIHRSPEGAESVGAAVVEVVETAAPETVAPETQATENQPEQAEKPKFTDWDRYQKLQEKGNNPNAKYTKADRDLAKKYEGKDESLIPGYQKPEQQADDSAPEPKPKAQEQKENPLHKLVGAKTDADVLPKVKGLAEQVQKLNGERGEVGRVLEEMGVKTLAEAKSFAKNAKALDQLVKDLKADRPEAFAFIGKQGPAKTQERFEGEIPQDILDEGLYRHMSTREKAANDRADKLERRLAAIEGDTMPLKDQMQRQAMETARTNQVTQISTEISKLVESTQGLWDSKKYGSLTKAVHDYYGSSGDFNPGLKPIMEIVDLAAQKNGIDLEDALAIWERKNGGSLIAQARKDAVQPFIGKKPSVGLSDQQGNHSGQFKSYTESSIKDMAAGRIPVPREWMDQNGTISADKVPANIRALLFQED